MSAEEHIKAAESLLRSIRDKVQEKKANLEVSSVILAEAQVHALLANAIATMDSVWEPEPINS